MPDAFLKALVRRTLPRPLRNWLRAPCKSVEWMWDTATTRWLAKRKLPSPISLSYCSDKMFLFDIGAHYGLFSLAAAHLRGQAVAVEPSAMAIRMITRQIALNHPRDS